MMNQLVEPRREGRVGAPNLEEGTNLSGADLGMVALLVLATEVRGVGSTVLMVSSILCSLIRYAPPMR